MADEIAELKKRNAELQKKLETQNELMNTLRKSYLKELMSLREGQAQGPEKFKQVLNVTYFDVTDGIDPSLVEILNMRLNDMSK